MNNYKEYFEADRFRYLGDRGNVNGINRFLLNLQSRDILLYLKILRKCHFCKNKLLNYYFRWRLRCYRKKYGLELKPECEIGKGLYLGHPYNITINSCAIIGDNCNIHKGVVIGQENRGKRKGAPIIGNRVWIGINSAVVGRIIVGDDVLIAPCTYVNCDIPSHSVVFGNPCIIKHNENATKDYINNIYEKSIMPD